MYIKYGDVMCSPKTLSFYTVERGQVIRPAQFINCNLYFATYAGTRRIDEGGFLCNSLLGSLPAGFKDVLHMYSRTVKAFERIS